MVVILVVLLVVMVVMMVVILDWNARTLVGCCRCYRSAARMQWHRINAMQTNPLPLCTWTDFGLYIARYYIADRTLHILQEILGNGITWEEILRGE